MTLRRRFTRWYVNKGYTMECKLCDYGDGVAKLIFHCPIYVKFLTEWLFSPIVYYQELRRNSTNGWAKESWC